MDQKQMEQDLLRQMRKIFRSKQQIALGVRPKEMFIFLSSIQFTRKNAQVREAFSSELASLEEFLRHVLTDMLPSCAEVIAAGSDDNLDVKPDGTPRDPEMFKAAMEALAKRGRHDD